jgi:hypothetical protein
MQFRRSNVGGGGNCNNSNNNVYILIKMHNIMQTRIFGYKEDVTGGMTKRN